MTADASGSSVTPSEIMRALAEHGLVASSQRVSLLGLVLNAHDRHVSADEIYQQLRTQFPTLSRATVYNNLGALAEAGLIERLTTYEGARFGPEARPHINLVCDVCGAIEDVLVGDPTLEGLVQRAAAGSRFEARTVLMSVSGRCSSCVER